MTIDEYTTDEMAGFFRFLDNLWTSGEVNMLRASHNLSRKFSMPVEDARSVLRAWRASFDADMSPVQRAAAAVDSMRAN